MNVHMVLAPLMLGWWYFLGNNDLILALGRVFFLRKPRMLGRFLCDCFRFPSRMGGLGDKTEISPRMGERQVGEEWCGGVSV